MGYFIDAVTKHYVDFSGSMGRKPYWMFVLFYIIFYVVAAVIDMVLGLGFIALIYSLALLLPSLAACIRRLHDSGRSGWWVLISLVPVIGFFVLLFFLVQPSKS